MPCIDINSICSTGVSSDTFILRMILSPKLAACLAKISSILLTYVKDRWNYAKQTKSPALRCASVLNSNESDPMGESAKRDLIRTNSSQEP